MKASSPMFNHAHMTPPMSAPLLSATLQRSALSRPNARRSYQSVVGKGPFAADHLPRTSSSFSTQTPSVQAPTSSHVSSPAAMSNRSSVSAHPGNISSPASVATSRGAAHQPLSAQSPDPASRWTDPTAQHGSSVASSVGSASTARSGKPGSRGRAAAHAPRPGQAQSSHMQHPAHIQAHSGKPSPILHTRTLFVLD